MEALRELRVLTARHAESGQAGPVVEAGEVTSSENHALGLKFAVARRPSEPQHHVYEPVFNLVVQGEKRAVLGGNVFPCRAGHFLVASVDLPMTIHLAGVSRERPFMGLGIKLTPAKVAALLVETTVAEDLPIEPSGLGVSDASTELLDAVLRFVRLIDQPVDLPVLAPLAEREILWRLLRSEQGRRVRQIGLADSRLSQVGRAMRWMREHYARRMRMEELARVAGMSVTSFHRHFRAVALMSPLQYMKQIRLQEARARLLAGSEDVTTVGLAVGYDSPSQFSREYKRAYGSPPGQDARFLRASSRGNGAGSSTSVLAHASK